MRAETLLTIVVCFVAIILPRAVAFAEDHEFKYKAPDAQSVELMCEFNGWKGVTMTKGDDGVWKTKGDLSPGTYAYKFLVNGKDWVTDPDAPTKKTVDNIENSAIEV